MTDLDQSAATDPVVATAPEVFPRLRNLRVKLRIPPPSLQPHLLDLALLLAKVLPHQDLIGAIEIERPINLLQIQRRKRLRNSVGRLAAQKRIDH